MASTGPAAEVPSGGRQADSEVQRIERASAVRRQDGKGSVRPSVFCLAGEHDQCGIDIAVGGNSGRQCLDCGHRNIAI